MRKVQHREGSHLRDLIRYLGQLIVVQFQLHQVGHLQQDLGEFGQLIVLEVEAAQLFEAGKLLGESFQLAVLQVEGHELGQVAPAGRPLGEAAAHSEALQVPEWIEPGGLGRVDPPQGE